MNKEFKKYFDKKIKDNTNKYVVMYKATLIFCIILISIALLLCSYNYFNNTAPGKITKILVLIFLYMFYPLHYIQNKVLEEENEVSRISKCQTKKDKIILKIYNITKVILLVGFGLWFFVAGFVNEILGLLKNWNEGEKNLYLYTFCYIFHL